MDDMSRYRMQTWGNRMDLQMERRMEQFLELSGLSAARTEPCMEFIMPPCRLYIECLDGRILLSLGRPVAAACRVEVLKRLLGQCLSTRLPGVPLRACLLQDQSFLSCSPARDSGPGHWMACHQEMRRLLDAAAGATW